MALMVTPELRVAAYAVCVRDAQVLLAGQHSPANWSPPS
jgi:hypothetical protein